MGFQCSKNMSSTNELNLDHIKNVNYLFEQANLIQNDDLRLQNISFDSFELISCIGKGGFSKVWKVKLKGTDEKYALKIINKIKAYNRKTLSDVIKEREFLKSLDFPFITNLEFCFDNEKYAFFAMKYNENNDLRKYLNVFEKFNENEVSKDFIY